MAVSSEHAVSVISEVPCDRVGYEPATSASPPPTFGESIGIAEIKGHCTDLPPPILYPGRLGSYNEKYHYEVGLLDAFRVRSAYLLHSYRHFRVAEDGEGLRLPLSERGATAAKDQLEEIQKEAIPGLQRHDGSVRKISYSQIPSEGRNCLIGPVG